MDVDYEATIGLEVHAQLRTRTKLFCGCPVLEVGAKPNVATCPVCMGHPGTLPVVNSRAVSLAVRAGTALGCRVHRDSVFDRKHYFYPDLPKGYQISQYERPLCTGGHVHALVDGDRRRFDLNRIHMEEDAGKMRHEKGRSLLNWNRSGVPLIEIVGEPDLHSAEEAEAWLRSLHRVLVTAEVCSGDMEKGHFRCDANVSLARRGSVLGTRVELK
ncbi:MAG: Asp-tRNA(Asn)/Glu-tRNA(Gln) amidotransferase GatCAB subunit B, partial [Myxococcota bacterium]|nr:Asp-tRNA(Asn)/Glu-tRNA(Gln) amidotransferase GatCAB subunit B [Myxococcota bacterium]